MNLDQYGLIVQNDGDGGDSCADTSRYCFARLLNGNPHDEMVQIMVKHLVYRGHLIRTPTTWDDIADCSRDQQLPFMICLWAYMSRLPTLLRTFNEIENRHKLRKWRYQNLDFASLHHRNTYTPMHRNVWGDFFLSVEAVLRVLDSWLFWDSSCGRDLNYQMMLLQISYYRAHSFWTRLAVRIYKLRGPEFAVSHYYRENNSEVGEEICRAIRKYF